MNSMQSIGRDTNTPRYTAAIEPEPTPAPTAPAPLTPTEKALGAAIHAINSSDPRQVNLFTAYLGLTELKAKFEEAARISIFHQTRQVANKCEPQAAKNEIGKWLSLTDHESDLARLADAAAGLAAIESDPDFSAAVATLKPLCDERDRLKSQIEAERHAIMQADEDIRQAEIRAAAVAAEVAANHPDVLAAKAAREKFDAEQRMAAAPALTRGKIKLASDPLQGDMH